MGVDRYLEDQRSEAEVDTYKPVPVREESRLELIARTFCGMQRATMQGFCEVERNAVAYFIADATMYKAWYAKDTDDRPTLSVAVCENMPQEHAMEVLKAVRA